MKQNSPNTSGAVTDQPEQALSCAAREVIMRKCSALNFSLRSLRLRGSNVFDDWMERHSLGGWRYLGNGAFQRCKLTN